jgi:hypothetical protein
MQTSGSSAKGQSPIAPQGWPRETLSVTFIQDIIGGIMISFVMVCRYRIGPGTMMEQDEFRALALTFPEAVESSHFDTADFRVRNKIFATLREADGRAVLKLSPDEQQLVMATSSGLFEPIKGSWGLKGWTRVILDRADIETVRHAMGMAWRSVAPRKLRADDAARHRGH